MSLKRLPPAPVHEEHGTANWWRWYNALTGVISEVVLYEPTINPTSVSANTTSEQAFTVTGVGLNDYVISITKPSHQAGLGVVNARVSAANQIAITFMNTTAGAIDPTGETYSILVLRG